MRRRAIFILGILLISQLSCTMKCNFSHNNVWQVPNTKLEIAVTKETSDADKKMVSRTMILRENYQDKSKLALARTGNQYARLNIYQMTENTFLLRDLFSFYELNTQTKTLQKINAPIESNTLKFIGAFDDNEGGNWRFIPVSERAEIPFDSSSKNHN